ncbi:WD40 repeat-like protein [Mycena amicta]|nr:WD40 repeat-like protein [Mycena amicta]
MNHHEFTAVTSQRPLRHPVSLRSTLYRPLRQRQQAVETLLANGFPYSRNLDKHSLCVNALAFSSLDGRFLASGGDDLDIHLWDLHEDNVRTPRHTLGGHRKNIFVLKFSANDRYLYSGGVDQMVLQYDVSTMHVNGEISRSADKAFDEHDENIRGIATHRTQDEVFLTASEDGRIIQHDQRAAPSARVRAQDILQLAAEVNGVEFHPTMDHIFATCDSRGGVCLRDMRMAFGPRIQRSKQGIVQTYTTRVSRQSEPFLANPEASSIVFNRQGTQLAVTMLNYFPTIYGLRDPDPIAVCSAPNLPNGTPVPMGARTYGNCSTIKHGAFGGPSLDEDVLYIAGSDDFRAYAWSLPSPAVLEARRTILTHDEWTADEDGGAVAFASRTSGPRCIPAQLDTPLARLGGHSSIVNTVQVHPQMLLVATAGVESRVVIHGAVDSLLDGMTRTSPSTRELGERWEWDGDREDAEWEDDQRMTMNLFDTIVREETRSGRDLFDIRRWVAPDEEEGEGR